MAKSFNEGQTVRVQAVLEPKQWQRHGTAAAARSPAIGDVGTVVGLDIVDGKEMYLVECVDAHGAELWLAQFEEEELEPMPT